MASPPSNHAKLDTLELRIVDAKAELAAGRYELLHELGHGRSGPVFVARHTVLRKRVAVRLLRAEDAESSKAARLLREAQVCGQLQHRNIIDITDVVRDEQGNLLLVMELLTGRTLDDALQLDAGLGMVRSLGILRQLARALVFAHEAGVAHRDLTPRNVFLVEGGELRDQVKLMGFDCARLISDEGVAEFSPAPGAYVAPEQRREDPAQDHRVDLFSFGVLAHRLLTGRLPAGGDHEDATFGRPASGALADTQLTAVHPELARLIESCLAGDPQRRPATMREVWRQLSACVSSAPTLTQDLVGTYAGSYRLDRMLGRGGLGSVWLAEHPTIGSRVAVKVLDPKARDSEDAVNRLMLEARAVNRIASPHIVRIFDFGKLADGRDYAVMELLEGETLGQRLRARRRFSWREARGVAIQIAEALLLAHQAGVIHRDLKPDNIFLLGDAHNPRIKLLDFGIAELIGENVRAPGNASDWEVFGTPLYVAPEQAAGEPCGPSADVYALGVLLYELLTGQPPLVGNVTEVLAAKMTVPAPSIGLLMPELGPDLVALIDGMLARDPEARPLSSQVLETLRGSSPSVARGLIAREWGDRVVMPIARDVQPSNSQTITWDDLPSKRSGRLLRTSQVIA